MPPNPPRGERALLVPSPSPVTLHYSPATTFLNENPERLYENSSLNKYLPLDDLPKTVDVCRTEVSLDLKSDYSEGILSDSVDSKSLLKNLVRNNSECTGFLMWFSTSSRLLPFMGVLREKIRLHAIFTKILANYISEEAS